MKKLSSEEGREGGIYIEEDLRVLCSDYIVNKDLYFSAENHCFLYGRAVLSYEQ